MNRPYVTVYEQWPGSVRIMLELMLERSLEAEFDFGEMDLKIRVRKIKIFEKL